MENQYLTEESKKEIIKVLVDEYEKILISETVNKSNNSALKKKQIEEFVNYLQTNENITHADLAKLYESIWPWLGKVGKFIGKRILGPLGIGWDAYDAYQNWPPKDPSNWGPGSDDWPTIPGTKIPIPMASTTPNTPSQPQSPANKNVEITEVRKAGLGTAIGQGIKKLFPWLVVPEVVNPLTPLTLDPIGIIPDIFVGPGGNSNPMAYPENRPDFQFPIGGDPDLDPEAPYPKISPAGHEYSPKPSWGNNSGNQPPEPPQNLPENMKAFWKNRLNEKINQNI